MTAGQAKKGEGEKKAKASFKNNFFNGNRNRSSTIQLIYRFWINFLPRKFWRERLLSGANKPRRDFPDFRSLLPGLWER